MKTAVVLILGCYILEAVIAKRCNPGERFLADDGCNWCICMQDGKNAACTLMNCPPKWNYHEQSGETVEQEKSGKICSPGKRFLSDDGCNWCICNKDGRNAVCTLMLCPPKKHDQLPENKKDTGHICTPGKRFLAEDGCNLCVFKPDGKNAVCTLRLCPPPKRDLNEIEEVEQECTPGQRVPAGDECNWCICDESGQISGCTMMNCLNGKEK
uniref:Putative serine protease inhibitor i/ii n=1 Tax=Panstrongylus lignarius TaxID=156445 RepID=A0A224XWH2_9HEMI